MIKTREREVCVCFDCKRYGLYAMLKSHVIVFS